MVGLFSWAPSAIYPPAYRVCLHMYLWFSIWKSLFFSKTCFSYPNHLPPNPPNQKPGTLATSPVTFYCLHSFPQLRSWFLMFCISHLSSRFSLLSLSLAQRLSNCFTGVLSGTSKVGMKRGIEEAEVRASHPWFKQSDCMFICFAYCLKCNPWLHIWKPLVLNPPHFFPGFL